MKMKMDNERVMTDKAQSKRELILQGSPEAIANIIVDTWIQILEPRPLILGEVYNLQPHRVNDSFSTWYTYDGGRASVRVNIGAVRTVEGSRLTISWSSESGPDKDPFWPVLESALRRLGFFL